MGSILTNIKKFLALFYGLIFLALSITNINAQNHSLIITDRPIRSQSSTVIPFNSFQIEFGFEYQKLEQHENSITTDYNNLILGNTIIKHGLSQNIELRIGAEYLSSRVMRLGNESEIKGIRGLFVGSKFQFRRNEIFISNAALVLNFYLPHGNINLRPKEIEPVLIASASQILNDSLMMGVNFGIQKNSNSNKLENLFSIFFTYNLSERMRITTEYFSKSFFKNSYLDLGFTYLIKYNLQVDFLIGTLLHHQKKDIYGKVGFSIRLPE